MSKMRMPEMSVVRFNESDVIVASLVVRFDNYANTTPNDGAITVGGKTYTKNNSTIYGQNIFVELGYDYVGSNPNVEYGGASHLGQNALYTMIDNDHSATENQTVDGVYSWDGSRFVYVKQ
ncbi:MAG: hypothetical protein J6O00_03595 [Clostridiales bacterium]|nr:hypothetical protein [Clostridiales bacterium]